MPDITFPDHNGIYQTCKGGLLLTLRWYRYSALPIWQYKVEAGDSRAEWSSDDLDIVATEPQKAVIEGALKGVAKNMPTLLSEIHLTQDDLRRELTYFSHATPLPSPQLMDA